MSWIIDFIDKKFYPEFRDRWDETILRNRIINAIDQSSSVLDLGAGRGYKDTLNFKGNCNFIAGVDPDREVYNNPHLDQARVQEAPDYSIPYENEQFDLVFSNSVIEHISNPRHFFEEVERVLKPGGIFIAKTPNQFHYVSILAKLTPHWFHEYYNRLRNRSKDDTFPTTYLCNSYGLLVKELSQSGFEVQDVELIEGRPEYLRLVFPAYLFGLIYERIVNSTELLKYFRVVIIVTAVKQSK